MNSKRKIAGTPVLLEAKARQASKLAEIRAALVAVGYDTTAKQAAALGVPRPTAWVLLNRDKRAGPSSVVIKRILSSPSLPPAQRDEKSKSLSRRKSPACMGTAKVGCGGLAISSLRGAEPPTPRWAVDSRQAV